MQLLEECIVSHGATKKSIRLYQGDLATIPPEEAVDCLVISAFPGDYDPTPTSLIGALARRGISVQELARDRDQDLRESFSCWISKDIGPRFPDAGFRRLLCFEPLNRGNPAELTRDVFSALMPFVLADPPIRSLAMPVLASGDQRFGEAAMLESMFRATVWWIRKGMPIDVVKIVVYSDTMVQNLQALFRSLMRSVADAPDDSSPDESSKTGESSSCFVSYSHEDSEAVDRLVLVLQQIPGLRIFRDTRDIPPGASWQSRIEEALENSHKIIAVYSPAYLKSPMCKDEFNLAKIRHRESNETVLVPIYLRSAILPLYMRNFQYIDCREADAARIEGCAAVLRAALS